MPGKCFWEEAITKKGKISVGAALELIRSSVEPLAPVSIPLEEASGLVLAEDVALDRDYPPFHRSAMDGYALRSRDFAAGIRSFHAMGTLLAGQGENHTIGEGECLRIMTGAPVPDSADAVVRLEDCRVEADPDAPGNDRDAKRDRITILLDRLEPWKDVAKRGGEGQSGEIVLRTGRRLDPSAMAVLAAVGHFSVRIHPRPTVSIVTTGDELVGVGAKPEAWQIRDSNSYLLRAALAKHSIRPGTVLVAADDGEALRSRIRQGLESDFLVLSGGVSKGDRDLVVPVLKGLGVRELFHGVHVKPGKPLFFGVHERTNCPVLALPGNPVASLSIFRIFGEALLRHLMGMEGEEPVAVASSFAKRSKEGTDEYVPVRLRRADAGMVLDFVATGGSGDFIGASRATGIARKPADRDGIREGELLDYYPW